MQITPYYTKFIFAQTSNQIIEFPEAKSYIGNIDNIFTLKNINYNIIGNEFKFRLLTENQKSCFQFLFYGQINIITEFSTIEEQFDCGFLSPQ